MLDFFTTRHDQPASEAPAVTLESFAGQSNAVAVRIEAGEDARELLPYLDRLRLIEVNFPVFGDGRGYSAARILREAGYEGELRATGDVLVDQIGNMVRCGFDSFAPDQPLDPIALKAALGRFPHRYQKAADAVRPVWALRHGAGNG
jgi:uncharacterized protein (DUF934 family)